MTTARCRHCDGLGRRALRKPLQLAYDALTDEWQTVARIRRTPGNRIKATALNGRLSTLVREGLAERRLSEVDSKCMEYRRT